MASEASPLEDLVMQVKLPISSFISTTQPYNKKPDQCVQEKAKANSRREFSLAALRLPNFLSSLFFCWSNCLRSFSIEKWSEHSRTGISSSRIPMASELDNDPPLEREKNRKEGDMVFNFRWKRYAFPIPYGIRGWGRVHDVEALGGPISLLMLPSCFLLSSYFNQSKSQISCCCGFVLHDDKGN